MNDTCPILEVFSLSKSYGTLVALRDVSFSVFPSQVFCLVGPNGAGKTTLIDCIVGLKNPDQGTVRIFGRDIRSVDHRKKMLRDIGVQFQHDAMYPDIRVEEALSLYARMYNAPLSVNELLSLFRIEHLRKKTYMKLSGGEKRKLLIAITLVGNPKLIFLDEPTSHLDPHSRKELWEILDSLREKGLTIFLSTHNMHEAHRQSDIICLIDSGEIIATGAIETLLEEFRLGFKFVINTEIDLDHLIDFPYITRVERDLSRTQIYGHGDSSQESIAEQLQSLGITEYIIDSTDLEDLYLLSTGKRSPTQNDHTSQNTQ